MPMSVIEKLQLQGVRSFGPHDDDRQNVEFFTPLTLILGQNGCGKTTIIECLKYVTTGDAPPGSKNGASFVHDPKMAKESTVKGQVKLLFRSTRGQEKIICRSLEATQKVKTITMKTMDSTITTKLPDNKLTNQVSSKCADVNADMFMSLGVTKSILNYVIFCHQEESNWPLEEGKKVKERFDEIFNSAKYKDCLNSIKEVRKQHMDDMKLKAQEMGFYKSDREMCRERRAELKRKRHGLTATEEELEAARAQLEPMEIKFKDILEDEKGFSHLQSRMAENSTKLQYSNNLIADLEKEMKEILDESVTEAEIDHRLGRMKASYVEINKRKEDISETIETLKAREFALESKCQKNAALLGQLISDKNYQVNKVRERDELFTEAQTSLGLALDQDCFTEELSKAEDKNKTKIRRLNFELKETEAAKLKEIDEIKEQKTILEETKKRGQNDLKSTKEQIAKMNRELSSLAGSGEELERLQASIDQKSAMLATERDRVNLDDLQTRISTGRSSLLQLENEEEFIKDELSELEVNQAKLQEIGYLDQDIRAKQDKREKLLNKQNSVFVELFGRVPELTRLRHEFKREEEVREEKVRSCEQEKRRMDSELQAKRNNCRDLKKERAKKTQKEKSLQARVEDVVDESEILEDKIRLSQDKIEALRKELQAKEAGKFTYVEMIEKMNKMSGPACPTCDRGFNLTSEAEDLKRDLQDRVDEIPRKVQGLNKKLKLESERLDSLQKIAPDYHLLKSMREELVEMNQQVNKLDVEIKNLGKDMTTKEADWTKAQEDMESLRGASEDVQQIDGLTREINVLTDKRNDLKSCLVGGSDRSLEVVRQENKTLLEKIKRLRKECESMEDELKKQTHLINSLDIDCNRLLNRKLEIEAKQQQRTSFMHKKAELEEKLAIYKKDIANATEQMEPLQDRMAELEAQRDQIKTSKEREIKALEEVAKLIDRYKSDLKKLDKTIRDFVSSGKSEKLEEAKQDKVNLDDQLKRKKEETKSLEDKLKNIIEEVASQDTKKRNLLDNLKLRKIKADKMRLAEEKLKLEAKLANTDYEVVQRNKRKLNQEILEARAHINSKEGKIIEMRRGIAEVQQELNQPKLKNAAKFYFTAVVKHDTLKMAVNDLNKYYKLLDKAIMRFHRDKMRIVNSIVREMWRKTYRGNDIDHIEIKTDDGEAAGGADKRKTYNYRVVMVKNGVDMDMRGRCSAGQKVLASLLIRLALAETFADSCGMIALDEPTTNLDRENIESLAMALTDIATRQAEHRNFQLVIITHDEEFIEQLSRCDKITYYQKVSRNSRGISEIRRINVSNLDQGRGQGE